MVRGAVVLGAAVMSVFVPGVPVGTAASMALAALVGMAASRLHRRAEHLADAATVGVAGTLRLARLCDDGALALCLLAVLFALPV